MLKWTAEVREKELQCLEEVELLDNHDPAVEFESDSESEAYDFLEKKKAGYFTFINSIPVGFMTVLKLVIKVLLIGLIQFLQRKKNVIKDIG